MTMNNKCTPLYQHQKKIMNEPFPAKSFSNCLANMFWGVLKREKDISTRSTNVSCRGIEKNHLCGVLHLLPPGFPQHSVSKLVQEEERHVCCTVQCQPQGGSQAIRQAIAFRYVDFILHSVYIYIYCRVVLSWSYMYKYIYIFFLIQLCLRNCSWEKIVFNVFFKNAHRVVL